MTNGNGKSGDPEKTKKKLEDEYKKAPEKFKKKWGTDEGSGGSSTT